MNGETSHVGHLFSEYGPGAKLTKFPYSDKAVYQDLAKSRDKFKISSSTQSIKGNAVTVPFRTARTARRAYVKRR